MKARDGLEAAVAKVEQATQPLPPGSTFNIQMERGRMAVVTVPSDITEDELLSIIGVIVGPARVQLAAQRAKPSALVRAAALPARA